MIPEAAVEAAAKAAYVLHCAEPGFDAEAAWDDMAGAEDWERGQWEIEARAALEAAAPHMLSHEREETRLAHLDAVVNAQTVGELQDKLDRVASIASQGPEDMPAWYSGFVRSSDILQVIEQ